MEREVLQAIICVHSDELVLEQLQSIVSERFGDKYVIEVAHCPSEAIAVVTYLQSINIKIATMIIGYTLREMNGISFTKEINKLSPLTKVILLAGQVSFEVAKDAINKVDLYRFIKMPYGKDQIISHIEEACFLVQQQVELDFLYERLRESEYEKNMILDSIAEEMIFIDEHYNVLWMNAIAKKDLHTNKSSGKCYEKLFGRKKPCPHCEAKDVFNHLEGVSAEKEFLNKIYRLVNFYPVLGNNKKSLGVVISMLDITSRKRVENMNLALLDIVKAVNNEDSIVAIYEQAYRIMEKQIDLKYLCVAGKDFDNVFIEYLNGRDKIVASKKYTQASDDYLSRTINKINHQIADNSDDDYIVTEKDEEIEIVIAVKDKIMILLFNQESFSVELSYKFLKTIVEQVKVSISKIENVKRITYQAHHDALTGLYNKEYFMKTIRGKIHAQRENDLSPKRNSLAVIDLNFFKEVNDSYGHIVGDEVLFVISQRILKSLRYGDVLGRIGGDEYAILISQQSKKEIDVVINRLQKNIAEPIIIGKSTINIGSSVGIVYDISSYISAELAVRDADLAMYEAKKDKSGVGCYKIFEVEVEEKFKQQNSIEEKLKVSSSQNDMLIKYQPIISITTGKIVGFEALIRWENDEGTIYLPNEFIPVAEESGYIEEIGKFVLDEVAKALELLNKEKENYYISVNFSAKQILSLTQMAFIKNFEWNNNLRIDIQENAIYKNFNKINKQIEELCKLGIKVHVDDFGLGYSSLSYLQKMDINDIKIDRTFVASLSDDDNSIHVVEAIISMAKSFGLTTIAEGVETKEQLDYLERLGCTYAQGYYIAKAMSIQDVFDFIKSWQTF